MKRTYFFKAHADTKLSMVAKFDKLNATRIAGTNVRVAKGRKHHHLFMWKALRGELVWYAKIRELNGRLNFTIYYSHQFSVEEFNRLLTKLGL